MLLGRVSALLFLSFAATAVAGREKARPGHPQATCLIHERDSYRDSYTMRGRNWNITEADFQNVINTDGTMLTRWEWMSAIDYDGAQVFKVKFRVPIHEEKPTKKKLAELVKPFKFQVDCWRSHDVGDWKPDDIEDFIDGKKPYHYTVYKKRFGGD